MKTFEARLNLMKQLGTDKVHVDSSIFVHDTMETAREIGLDLFGTAVSNDTILAIYDRLCARELIEKLNTDD
jgi:hypothetical protein